MDLKQTQKMTGQQPGCKVRHPKHNPFFIALLPGNFLLPGIRKIILKVTGLKLVAQSE